MGPTLLVRVAGVVVPGICLLSAVAIAADAEPVRLEFQAPPACADGTEFLRVVLFRTARIRAAVGGETARTFHVDIHADEQDKLSGDFSITDPSEGESDERTIKGESCGEVFDALTLFAALSVDPDALTANPPPPVPEPTREPAQHTAPVEHQLKAPPSPATESAPPRRGLRAGAGCDVGALNAGTSRLPLLLEPFVEVQFPHVPARIAFVPTIRLAFSSLGAESDDTADGRARLHWTTARLDGCPAQLEVAGSLAVRPCLALAGGTLSAAGETIAHPESHTLGWWTLGGLFRLEWSPWSFLSLEANAGLDLPLRRDEYYFEPKTEVYRAPATLGRGSVGAAIHFL